MKSGLCPIVLQRTARVLTLAIVLAVGCVFDWPSHEAQAQQVQHGSQLDLDYSLPTRRGPKLGTFGDLPRCRPRPQISVRISTFPLEALRISTVDQDMGITAARPHRLPIRIKPPSLRGSWRVKCSSGSKRSDADSAQGRHLRACQFAHSSLENSHTACHVVLGLSETRFA